MCGTYTMHNDKSAECRDSIYREIFILRKTASATRFDKGKLRIGDNWNAITIIALSLNNPLKAIAEFVENSIDAHARIITIIRGRERGEHFLKTTDDGDGIPLNAESKPDFKYVATHICDSIKREIKIKGARRHTGRVRYRAAQFLDCG